MSHSGGIIVADANGGIDVRGDIATVLGVNSGDVWTLYNHAIVNKWSKKKPVNWSLNGTMNVNPQGAYPSTWFQGVNGNYGLVSASALTSNLISKIDGGLNGWAYTRDTLAARVLDFNGYDQNAENPFDYLYLGLTPTTVASGGDITLEYQLRRDVSSDTNLGLFDLKAVLPTYGAVSSLSILYLAVVIYKNDGTYYDWASADEQIGSLLTDPAMHHFTFTAPTTLGTYKFVPVIVAARKQSASQAIGDIVTIPGVTVKQFEVARNVEPYMEVDAFVYNTGTGQNPNFGNTVYFYCTFYGGSNGGTFNDISLSFETSTGSPQMTLSNVQNGGSSGNLTVSANSEVRKPSSTSIYSKTWAGSVSLENFIRQYSGRARMYPGSGSTIAQYIFTVREAAAMPSGTIVPF